jgi:hypothetical protein
VKDADTPGIEAHLEGPRAKSTDVSATTAPEQRHLKTSGHVTPDGSVETAPESAWNVTVPDGSAVTRPSGRDVDGGSSAR